MDFVTGLLISNGFDAILIIINKLTKMRYFILINIITTAETVADLYVNNIYRLYGILNIIISDRGPQFVALF